MVSTLGGAGEAVDTTGGLSEGGVTGAEDTTMAGTLLEFFFSSGVSGCWGSWPVSTVTAVTVWGCTLAGVWARLGRVLVPGGGVFLPVGVLEAAAFAGTSGDKGRLLGAAGDGGLFLGFGVLVSGLDLWFRLVGDAVCRFFCTFSFVRAFFSFSFSLSLSFFSFFFLSTGVEFRLRWRWVMSGVLAEETLQRSALLWLGW